MPASWHALSPLQRAMLQRIALGGPLAVGTKIEMRTVASLNRRGLLRPGNTRSGGPRVKGRWCLTAAGRGLVAARAGTAAPDPTTRAARFEASGGGTGPGAAGRPEG